MPTVDLDDVAALRALDTGDMLGTVADLGAHVQAGYAAGRATSGLPSIDDVRSVNPKVTSFEASCFSGVYITGDVTQEYLDGVEEQRRPTGSRRRRSPCRAARRASSPSQPPARS